jgi:hypothetical protein
MVRSIGYRNRQGGFSLLLLSVWLIGLGTAVALVLALLPNRSEQLRIEQTIRAVETARHDVLAFVVENYRLPEPDTNASGTENGGATMGALPYRSMELPQAELDPANLPLRYAPYRNSTDSADLASATSLYEPTLPTPGDYDCTATIPTSPVNLLDFCIALANAEAAAESPSYANTGPGISNAAYVLVSGGLEDADGNGADSSLDGANDDGDVSFEDPARGREEDYDDIVRSVPFAALQRELSCGALLGSLDLLVQTADDGKNLADNIQVQKFQADVAVALEAIATVLNGIVLVNAITDAGNGSFTTGLTCAAAVLSLGAFTPQCIAAGAATASAFVAAAVAAVDLAVSLAKLGTAIALAAETTRLRDSAYQSVCDSIDDVVAADARGGLQ